MAAKADFIMETMVRDYVKNTRKFRVYKKAVSLLSRRFNELIKTVAIEAEKIAKKDRRKTISPDDIEAAIEKHVGKKDLSWEEILEQLVKHPPAGLGNISKGINDYVAKKQR